MQNHWTVKYRSLWPTFILSSKVVSHWLIIKTFDVHSSNSLQDTRKNHWTVKYRSWWPSPHDTQLNFIRLSEVWPSSSINCLHKKKAENHFFRVATLMQKQNSLTFHWLFPDQIQFFTDQNTAVLQPICLLAADKWQIPFTSSLNCTSLILQIKEIKSLNSFLAQNVPKLKSFHSFERAKRAREKIIFFSNFKSSKYLLQHIFWAKIMKFPDFSLTFLVFKISLTNLQMKKNQISLTFPWPVATLLFRGVLDFYL